ncbi:MAG: transcription initiation factor IIB, partial [Desulfobacterales bacterium]|nr:transcription initiation factor IIB [Desulfobacterales bacterium]
MKGVMRSLGELVSYACSECGSSNIIHDAESGEIICGGCGLVLAESSLYTGPEWRAFTMEERDSKSRAGMPPSFAVHDKGLSTVIRVGRDAYGRRLPPKTKIQMFRLRRWQGRSVYDSVERNLAQTMSELGRLSDRLHIPPFVRETAAVIYRKALKR